MTKRRRAGRTRWDIYRAFIDSKIENEQRAKATPPPAFEPAAYTPTALECSDVEEIRKVKNKRKAARKAGKPLPRWP